MAKIADPYLSIDPWKIIEDGFFPEKSRVSESLFSLGNEHQGVRGYFEEGYGGDSLVGVYLNGIYEEHLLKEPMHYKGISNRICYMVNTANWLYTRILLDGETLDLAKCRFADYRRELDFKSGELRRELTWITSMGKQLRLVFSRFLSMTHKEMAYQRISLTPLNFDGDVTLTLAIDFSILHQTYQINAWDCPERRVNGDACAILGVSRHIRQRLFAGFQILSAFTGEKEAILEPQMVGSRFVIPLSRGNETRVERRNVLYTPRDPLMPLAEAWQKGQQLLQEHRDETYETALQQNRVYWNNVWEKGDINIDGDPETQQGIRFCIFQMEQTYRGIVDGANIGAKGLTGEVYNGNAFWDTETYFLPFYLFNNPQAARALLNYRYKTLPQALDRARQLDCQGACYPIATIDGTESCTLWQHASLQLQPTTAVAYAIRHYVLITRDTDYLYTTGIELLLQICRFLASRGQWAPGNKGFGYYAVMGPDEFQMMVNNNCYTNLMAQKTFEYTLEVLDDMQKNLPEKRAAIAIKTGLTASEPETWKEMAQRMIIPRDEKTGIYEQHQGFFDLPHVDIHAIPVGDFPLYNNWAYDRIYRNDMIKQPDVLMFLLLYNQSFTLAEKQANYDYYEPRCIHESSLSPSVHSILAAELGRSEAAFELFRFAARIDLDNYNRNTAEGIHITSIVAAWMNIVYGFGGLRSDSNLLVFNPSIPRHWKSYSFQVLYRGSRIRVDVDQKRARLILAHGQPVALKLGNTVRTLDENGLEWALPSAQ